MIKQFELKRQGDKGLRIADGYSDENGETYFEIKNGKKTELISLNKLLKQIQEKTGKKIKICIE